ncbi:MAG: AraC-like ligand-binding domain-containing protein, partial [Nocardioides sp.]
MAAFLPLVERHGGRFLANSLAVVQGSDLGAVQVSRTLAHVSEDQPASYTDPGNALVWAFVTRGTVSVRKQRSALDTAPGAMSVQHFQRELTFQYTPDLDALSIRMDADALGLRPREVDALSSVASPVASSAQRLMWSVVSHALRAPVTASPATRAAMARSVVDFTTVFVDEFLGRLTAPEVERRNLVTEGLRHIAIHASDHRLDPARVADAVHVSLRALQKAFQ